MAHIILRDISLKLISSECPIQDEIDTRVEKLVRKYQNEEYFI